MFLRFLALLFVADSMQNRADSMQNRDAQSDTHNYYLEDSFFNANTILLNFQIVIVMTLGSYRRGKGRSAISVHSLSVTKTW